MGRAITVGCQRSAGAPMVSWAVMPADNLRITGGAPVTINSSGDCFHRFCGRCGTGLFHVNETFLPGLVDVQSMTLDAPEAFPPQAQVQTTKQPGWMAGVHTRPAYPRHSGMDSFAVASRLPSDAGQNDG